MFETNFNKHHNKSDATTADIKQESENQVTKKSQKRNTSKQKPLKIEEKNNWN